MKLSQCSSWYLSGGDSNNYWGVWGVSTSQHCSNTTQSRHTGIRSVKDNHLQHYPHSPPPTLPLSSPPTLHYPQSLTLPRRETKNCWCWWMEDHLWSLAIIMLVWGLQWVKREYYHIDTTSVLSILESIQGRRIFKSAVCMHHLWCAYCRIFLICLCSAGDDKTEQNIFIKMNCSNLTRVNRPQTAVSQYEGCILSTFSHRNSSRTSQKPPPRQARLWLVERSPGGLWLVERSPVSQALVFMSQLCQGLNCLQIAALWTQFVMKLLTAGLIILGQIRSNWRARERWRRWW